ncbi:MAG: transposase, partial [Thermoanaerobaculia bacterium]|nr:transposase [Thermoanaerobaculia bacterium]
MPRIARLVVPGLPHHVTHRGNRRGAVFFGAHDCDAYLRDLARAGGRYGLELWAYCLMTNHVHLIARPLHRESLARAIGEVHGRHARRVHRERGWDGHLWANRYFSAPLDNVHLWAAVRYVEQNPVRAGIVRDAERFPWSSAAAHCGLAPPGPLAPARPFPGAVSDWAAWLAEQGDEVVVQAIRKGTATGRPAGAPAFVAA